MPNADGPAVTPMMKPWPNPAVLFVTKPGFRIAFGRNRLLALATAIFGAGSLVCSCVMTNEQEAKTRRLESMRESNPAAYEDERVRSLSPATQDEPNWPLPEPRR